MIRSAIKRRSVESIAENIQYIHTAFITYTCKYTKYRDARNPTAVINVNMCESVRTRTISIVADITKTPK